MTIDEKAEVLRVGGATTLVTVYGLTLNEWVAAITIFYLLAQIVILAPKAYAVIAAAIKRMRRK